MKYRRTITAFLLVGVFVFSLAWAVPVLGAVDNYSLGIGFGIVPDYEGSSDYQVVPSPFARVNWDNGMYLELQGLKLKVNLLDHETITIGPVARYRFGRDDVDNSKVDDLKDVDDAFELGAFLGIKIDQWNASLEILQDVADGHEGVLVTLGGGYRWPVNETVSLSVGVSTTYADDDYMDTFFSIDTADSIRSRLRTFDADSGFKDVGIKLGLGYRLSGNWRMQALARYTRLLGDTEDSPVVEDEGDASQYFGGVIFVYRFGKAKERPVDAEPY